MKNTTMSRIFILKSGLLLIAVLAFGLPSYQGVEAATNTATTCSPPVINQNFLVYGVTQTCSITAPAGMDVVIGDPQKYNGAYGLSQDYPPYNWRVTSINSPGWNCTEIADRAINCYPNGQSAGTIIVTFDAYGQCGFTANVGSKAFPAGTPYSQLSHSWHNDGTWADFNVPFPVCPTSANQCSDGIDNDSDGAIDFPSDFSCSSATDNDETNPKSQCQDGIDNDSDGLTDYPNDPGCANKQDNDESNSTTAQCQDGIDNDGDGAVDYPSDFSCSSGSDTDETNPKSQCQDGADNDSDGLIDYPNDPGCANKQDNSEQSASSIACNTNSDCGVSGYIGSLSCQGNGVYQTYKTYTCNNPGTGSSYCSNSSSNQLQNTCASNQTCSNGICLNVSCSSNSSCGTDNYTGSSFCMGNSVYRNYTAYTCNNPGGSNSSCSAATAPQLQQTCASSQTCSFGSCVNTGSTCNNHSYQQCSGNAVYWYDSCGTRQDVAQYCSSNQTCSGNSCTTTNYCANHSNLQCAGNSVYWFNSCGAQQDLYQTCSSGQTCSNGACVAGQQQTGFVISKTVRNLSSGSLNWSSSVAASPSDVVQFEVILYNYSNQTISNITVRDILPANLIYNNNLTIDNVANSGNITQGVSVANMSPGQTRTLIYQARVADSTNFVFGTTTLTNSATATGTGFNPATASASVVVTKSGVLGATTISTGLAENGWIVSTLLFGMAAIGGMWIFGTRLLRLFGFVWLDLRKQAVKGYITEKQLKWKIRKIQNKER